MIHINVMTAALRNVLNARNWRRKYPEKSRSSALAYYYANRAVALERRHVYCKENPEKVRACSRASARIWRKEHPEKVRENTRAWAKAHPDKVREKSRVWYQAHPETRQAWEKAHPEKRKEIEHKYRRLHPEKVREKQRVRRARKLNAGGSFTNLQFKQLCASFGNTCLCCKRSEVELASLGFTLVPDHVVALSRGGSNDIINIQPLCGPCNARKQTKHIDYRKETEICQAQAMKANQ